MLRKPIVVALLFLLFFLISLSAAHQEKIHYWDSTYGDNLRLQQIYTLFSDETLFTRDGAYQDAQAFSSYTPSWFTQINLADFNTADYPTAAANLFAFYTLISLCGASVLFLLLTRSIELSIAWAVMMLHGFVLSNDFWNITSISSMLPRTTAHIWIMLAIYLYWLILCEKSVFRRRLIWALIGVTIGITTIFHSPSAIGLASTMFVLNIVYMVRMRTLDVLSMVLLVITTLIVAFPTIQQLTIGTVLDLSGAATVGVRQLPDALYAVKVFGVLANSGSTLLSLGIVIGWFSVSLACWVQMNRSPIRLWRVGFCLAQVLMAVAILPTFSIVLTAVLCYIIVTIDTDDQLNNIAKLCEIIMAILATVLIVATLLTWTSILLQNERIFLYLTQLLRTHRFINVPIFMLLAYCSMVFIHRIKVFSLEHLFLGMLIVASVSDHGTEVAIAVMVSYGLYRGWQSYKPANQVIQSVATALLIGFFAFVIINKLLTIYILWKLVLTGAAVIITLLMTLARRSMIEIYFVIVVVILGMVVGVSSLGITLTSLPLSALGQLQSLEICLLLTVLAVAVLYLQRGGESFMDLLSRRALPVGMGIALVQCIYALTFNAFFFQPPPTPVYVEAGRWIQENTAKDDLIFLAINTLDYSIRPMVFRIESERSQTDKSQDFLISAQNPSLYLSQLQEQKDILKALSTADTLVAKARELNADYIVMDTDIFDYQLSIPVTTTIQNYAIYELKE